MILQDWFEVTPAEMQTFIIELIISLIAIGTVVGLLFLKKKYSKLTKKGFSTLILGYFVYALHFLLDLRHEYEETVSFSIVRAWVTGLGR